MSYQPRSTNPYIMEKKLNEYVGGGGFDPSVIEEIETEISVLGSENVAMAQDIIDIKGSLNSINNKLLVENDFTLFTYTYDAVTINANSNATVQPTNALPAGARVMGITKISSGNTDCIPRAVYSDGTVGLRNLSSSAITTTPELAVRYLAPRPTT